MWSSGFHFCLLMLTSQRSTFDGYFLNDKYVKGVKKGCLGVNGTQRRVKLSESEGENPAIFCCTESRVRFEETVHQT